MNQAINQTWSVNKALLVGVIALGLAMLMPATSLAAEGKYQLSFKTPEAAVEALLKALKANDTDALLDLFGREYDYVINGKDKVAARENRKKAWQAANTMHGLREDGPDVRILVIGENAWPMPVPVVRDDAGWYFDTGAGIDEMLNRIIGENELTAIDVCRVYLDAQAEYASVDRDGDGVLEAAKKFRSTDGKQDGLYWKVSAAGSAAEESPLDDYVAQAHNYLEGRKPGDPFKGYYYKILTRQGKNAPGGAHNYNINGNMIAGYALVAYPADYGNTGIMSLMVSHQGLVYEKDLGDKSVEIGHAMTEFNPDDSWSLADD